VAGALGQGTASSCEGIEGGRGLGHDLRMPVGVPKPLPERRERPGLRGEPVQQHDNPRLAHLVTLASAIAVVSSPRTAASIACR
jgi:hypothetical protein